MEVYARYCHKKVEKMTMTGAKKGIKKPTIDEIVQAKVRLPAGTLRHVNCLVNIDRDPTFCMLYLSNCLSLCPPLVP